MSDLISYTLFLRLHNKIDDPPHKRAFESGTTQTARRLDGGTLRQRRPPNTNQRATTLSHSESASSLRRPRGGSTGSYASIENATQQPKSSHAIFFGTDDVTTLKEKSWDEDIPEMPETKEPEFANAEEAEAWREMCDLARSVFYVYFTNNDCDNDIAHMRKSQAEKKTSLLSRINGTMPWLPTLIDGSSAPNIVKTPTLFMEASFRGIAQVRTLTSLPSVHEIQYTMVSHIIPSTSISSV